MPLPEAPIYSAQPYVEAINKTLALIDRLRKGGYAVNCIDIGGGFAADYGQTGSPTAADYAAEIVPLLRGKGLRIILEPGRTIGCNAGILLTKVLYLKEGGERKFCITDGAMTDLIRPALYDAFHFIWPAKSAIVPQRSAEFVADGAMKMDIVGGVCESSDFLAKERMLPPVQRGDLLAVFSAGAYGFVMSSQYNARPRVAEVLVEGSKWRPIRRRETYDDLIAAEQGL